VDFTEAFSPKFKLPTTSSQQFNVPLSFLNPIFEKENVVLSIITKSKILIKQETKNGKV